jgi:hypothetical protein
VTTRTTLFVIAISVLCAGLIKPARAAETDRKPVAVLVADWRKVSHPEAIFTNILRTYSRDGRGLPSKLRIASVYRDLPSKDDISNQYAAECGFTVAARRVAARTRGPGEQPGGGGGN